MAKFAEPKTRSASSPASPTASAPRRGAATGSTVLPATPEPSRGVRRGVTEVWNPHDIRFVQVNEGTRDFVPVDGAQPRGVSAGPGDSTASTKGDVAQPNATDTGSGAGSEAALSAWLGNLGSLEGSYAAWKGNSANQADKGGETNFGLTWDSFHKMRPSATKEQFAALTEEQVTGIARGLFRVYGTDRVADPGLAVLLADSFWGGFSADALNRAFARMGGKPLATMGPLSAAAIAQINALPAEELAAAYVEERQAYHERIAQKDPSQRVFLKGWNRRLRTRWIQGEVLRGRADVAARWLNGQSLEVLDGQLSQLSRADISALHSAALTADGVGPQSRFAQRTDPARLGKP